MVQSAEPKYSLGIDPGWANLGAASVLAVSPFRFKILHAKTYNPSGGKFPEQVILDAKDDLVKSLPDSLWDTDEIADISIERYVSYGNVRSTHTEEILMVIGMLKFALWEHFNFGYPVMLKAIDWKTKLCQALVQHTGFDNPSKKGLLDKEFSVAAAKHLTINNDIISDDHQADAICLAAYPQVMAHAKQAKAAKANGTDSSGSV